MRVAWSNLVFNGKKYVKNNKKVLKIFLMNKMIWQGMAVYLTGVNWSMMRNKGNTCAAGALVFLLSKVLCKKGPMSLCSIFTASKLDLIQFQHLHNSWQFN